MLQELLIQLVMTLENSETKSLSRKNLIKLFDDGVVNKNPRGKPRGIFISHLDFACSGNPRGRRFKGSAKAQLPLKIPMR